MNDAAPTSAAEPPPASKPVEGGAADPSTSLLRRRKKTRRRLSYVVDNGLDDDNDKHSKENRLSEAQESVFLNMYIRKMRRRVSGTYSNDSLCCEFVVVVALCVVIIALGWDTVAEDEEGGDMERVDTIGLVVFLLWAVFVFGTFFVLGNSTYVRMLRYMVIYIPLLYFVGLMAFYKEMHMGSTTSRLEMVTRAYPLLALLILLEVGAFLAFMAYYKLGPRIVQSNWFRNKPGRVQRVWNIKSIVVNDAWTMTYRGHNPTRGSLSCQLDYSCKYEGDVDPTTGLPDGLGRWIDDAWEGEMLTGYWKQGSPIAPFSSWDVGNDDAVVAVRAAYFKATDDAFSKNKFHPTNDQNPPECGVAGVECSVSGSFYKHLPHVTLIEGPYVVEMMPTQQHNPVREVLSHLIHVGEASEEDDDGVHIRASDVRGVQVLGHVYAPTGRFHSPDATSVHVEVEWGSPEEERGNESKEVDHLPQSVQFKTVRHSARSLQKSLFMPKPCSEPTSKYVAVEVEDSSEGENSNGEDEVDNAESAAQMYRPARIGQNPTEKMKKASLRVHNWVPCRYKEALIFFPGYNSCMEASLKNLGQFLAMTKLSRHVWPIVFVWPGSKNVGYPYASKISATDINQQNVLKLVHGLKEAGIKRIHLLSHSMGVQTLLGAFSDKYDDDGNSIGRSDVSKEFALDPDFDEAGGPKEGKRQQYTNRMTCRSITLLNPDFPVRAFVDRGFLSIRRVCQTITVVGDRNDRALGWSSFINGVAPHFGYEEPQVLWPTIGGAKRTKWELERRIGRSLAELYFPPEVVRQRHGDGNGEAFRHQLFNKAKSADLSEKKRRSIIIQDRYWLDLDVIDMTGLDTNIKGMRHSGFSLNGMLLKDLQELFSTGKRAMKRSTLLYREGNQFSFVRAPSFVSQ